MTDVKTRLPEAFRRIRLELAREPGHPAGDPSESYMLIAPLDSEGRIDAALVREHRGACKVVRTHRGETAAGRLVHGPGGHWLFEYDDGSVQPERGFRFEDERVRQGEYLSIVRQDGEHPFRVTSVTPI